MQDAAAVASGMPYHCGQVGHPASGWRFIPSEKKPDDLEFLPSEGLYQSKGGRWESPRLPCAIEPFSFYRLRFRSRFTDSGFYAVVFHNDKGDELVEDAYGSIEASQQWMSNECCVRGREDARTFHLSFISHGTIDIENVVIERVDQAVVCKLADQLYATLPPLRYRPAPDRWRHIPRTMRRLRTGGSLRVVMLGDSIVNDTNNSNWDALVARNYTGCRIQVVASVRGSTGCWYFREDANLKSYVIDRRPDLLMIGGISHLNDLDAIRAIIVNTRAQSDCEILLTSGPVGPWDVSSNPAPDPFNMELASLAGSLAVEFLDLNSLWHEYVSESKKPRGWFHRDAVHANDRGKQVLARLLERYFSPDPSADVIR